MFILENVKRQVVVQIFTWFNFVQTSFEYENETKRNETQTGTKKF